MLPILYSYRRCPFAIRARMALKYAGVTAEIREISLKSKPAELLAISSKGTVPVLVWQDAFSSTLQMLDQSIDIMYWALQQQDLDGWIIAEPLLGQELIAENDTSFKEALDKYKYAVRFPEYSSFIYRAQAEIFLNKLECCLVYSTFLVSEQISLADIAIFPFVRQFAGVDKDWFEVAPYPNLRAWLNKLVSSDLFKSVMKKMQ